jgi:pimeloyl-ACP methyl ester carboxylesterase
MRADLLALDGAARVEAPAPDAVRPAVLRVPAADGLCLQVLEWRRGRVPLLLVHGFADHGRIWDDFALQAPADTRVLALELRGHGDSDWSPRADYGTDAHVRDLEALFPALDLARAVLVGHSLGGMVAAAFAAGHPQQVAGLVLVDVGPRISGRGVQSLYQKVSETPDLHGSFAECLAHAERTYWLAGPAAVQRMARHGFRRRPDGRYEAKLDPALRGRARAAGSVRQPAQLRSDELWAALRRLRCPTLVVRAEASAILSRGAAQQMTRELLGQGELVEVPSAGHALMVDNPEGFREAVHPFLTKLVQRT